MEHHVTGVHVPSNSLSIWRTDRCKNLGEQVEVRAGCRSGIGCRHDCKLGLPAVPKAYCQACTEYVALPRENPVYPVPWVGDLVNVREEEPPKPPAMKWQYGVTTVVDRMNSGMTRATLDSLARAGFDRPRLFVDRGLRGLPDWAHDYPITAHSDPVMTAANWVLALYELWARDSTADRFAVFQDDFVTYPHLREYLEWCHYPEKGYWNLYTFPQNQLLAPRNPAGGTIDGWFRSNQRGKGAVALVFDALAVRALLGQSYLVDRFLSVDHNPIVERQGKTDILRRCDRQIDGGIVEAMKRVGYEEWCHSPSLVQHAGLRSAMGNDNQKQADSWRGEGYDAREMIVRT